MLGKLKELSVNRDGTQNITITVQADYREEFDRLLNKDVSVEIKQYYPGRSLDANARCWALIDMIAAHTGYKKTEVYQNAIKDIGGVSEVVCVMDIAADTLCKNWCSKGQGWMAEKSPSKLPGCTNVTLWYGSSIYDKRQMGELIDSLVQDADNLGLPSMSPKERDRLLEQWSKKVDKESAA